MKADIRAVLDGRVRFTDQWPSERPRRQWQKQESPAPRLKAVTPGANPSCTACGGTGSLPKIICHCVRRTAFSTCLGFYREFKDSIPCVPRPYTFLKEDFRADFYKISRRTLDNTEWKFFDLHFLQDLPWRVCAPALGMNRGQFFHATYRLMVKLGAAFMETKPYPLYPVEDYFSKPSKLAA